MLSLELIFFFILGSIFGSFANVLILRLPDEKSIVPGSHCYQCSRPIKWYHNIPILSWLWLRGHCAQCGAKFSVQYLVVELLMAILFSLAYLKLGWSWYLLEILIFIFASLTASFIDLKHYILPDLFTLGGLCLALLGAALNPERSFWDAFLGFAIGGGFLYLTAYLHFLLRKVEGMGGGDIKLMAWIGALMGWQSLLFVLVVAGLTGALAAVLTSVLFKRSLKDPIPFGPFLTAGALLFALVDSHTMVQHFFPWAGF